LISAALNAGGLELRCASLKTECPFWVLAVYPIVPILSVPVDILHTEVVGKRTAQALSAREAVEPRLKRRICKSAIVSCGQLDWHQYRRQAKRKDCQTDESAHRGLRQEVPRVR
jgi:hypothetical protein